MTYLGMLLLVLLMGVHLSLQVFLPTDRGRNLALLAVSLVFYALTTGWYTLALILMTLVVWLLANRMAATKDPGPRRTILLVGVVLSLILFGVHRVLLPLLADLQSIAGVPKVLPAWAYPMGVGVYSLMLVGYLLDVYRGSVKPQRSFLTLLTYSSLFYLSPMGPIPSYRGLRPALEKHHVTRNGVYQGVLRLSLGIGKKMLLADALATILPQYLPRSIADLGAVPTTALWLGVILSAIQLYLLFSAYGDMAVGMGLITGIRVPESFQYPLCSSSVGRFLSRWFIPLRDFFEYYLGPVFADKNQVVGLLLCYVLMGLWFGGSWTFLLWGAFVAGCLLLEQRYLKSLPAPAKGILGVIGIFWSFVFFSFTTLPRLFTAIKGLFFLGGGFHQASFFQGLGHQLPLILLSILFCLPLGTILGNLWRNRFRDQVLPMTVFALWQAIYPIILVLLSAICYIRGTTFLL